MRAALCALLLGATPAVADTLHLRTFERHVAIGSVVAHVLSDGTAYAVDGSTVLPLAPDDLRITHRAVRLILPDRTLECALPSETLDESRGLLHQRTGTQLRVTERFRLQTWLTACPDGPGVIWQATDHTTIVTKGP